MLLSLQFKATETDEYLRENGCLLKITTLKTPISGFAHGKEIVTTYKTDTATPNWNDRGQSGMST